MAYVTGPEDLIALGQKLAEARAAFDDVRTSARDAAARAAAAGVPDAEIARRLQVDRMTVRTWLGKSRPKSK